MKRSIAVVLSVVVLALVAVAGAAAREEEYPWLNHAPPYDYRFGNMIDSHQQTRLLKRGTLAGYLYIHFTGEYTAEGYPIARKAHCPTEECNVGWVVRGVPMDAKLVCLAPRTWEVDPTDLPRRGGYTHFHWVGDPWSPHGQGHSGEGLVVGDTYNGFLMRRVAFTTFWWTGSENSSNPGHLVVEGLDPHSNIVVPGQAFHCGDSGGSCGDGGCGGH